MELAREINLLEMERWQVGRRSEVVVYVYVGGSKSFLVLTKRIVDSILYSSCFVVVVQLPQEVVHHSEFKVIKCE